MTPIGSPGPGGNDVVHVIRREAKGLTVLFYPTRVVKQYDNRPTCITLEDQERRFMSEVAAYQRFEELQCPFVPELIDFSIEHRWLCIARIEGDDLLALSQSQKRRLPARSLLRQIDQMNEWLRSRSFGDMENSIKDMILTESDDLYLVDFEPYSSQIDPAAKPDIYDALIDEFLQRIYVRRGRKAGLTPQFIRLSVGLLSRRPLTAIKLALRDLRTGLRYLSQQVLRR